MSTVEKGLITVKYDLSVTLDLPYEKAVVDVRAALKEKKRANASARRSRP